MLSWRRFVIEESKDAQNHRATQFVLCKEHLPMLLRLILRIRLCMRPTDNLAVISA